MLWTLGILIAIVITWFVWNMVHFPLPKELGWKHRLLAWLVGPGFWTLVPSARTSQKLSFFEALKAIPQAFQKSDMMVADFSISGEIAKHRQTLIEVERLKGQLEETKGLLEVAKNEIERLRSVKPDLAASSALGKQLGVELEERKAELENAERMRDDAPAMVSPEENPNIIKLEITGKPPAKEEPMAQEPAQESQKPVPISFWKKILQSLFRRYEPIHPPTRWWPRTKAWPRAKAWIEKYGWSIPVAYFAIFLVVIIAGESSQSAFVNVLRWALTFGIKA